MVKRLCACERREQVLARIASVFAAKGFRSTTAELARASGVSEAMLFKLFGDKRGMYAALIERKIRTTGDSVFPREAAEAGDDRAFFGAIGLALLRQMRSDPCFLRLLLYSALEDNELARMFYEARVKKVIDFSARYLRRRIREGAFRRVDPETAASAFLSMVSHYVLSEQVFRMRLPRTDDPEKLVGTFVDVFLEGVRK